MKMDEFDWLMQQGQYEIFSEPIFLSASLDDDLRSLAA